MKKHAYLIMAHTNWSQVMLLLSLLDDSRNDLFLHIDKSKMPTCSVLKEILHTPRLSKLILVKNVPVSWGGFSMIQAELELLEAAIKGHYEYYHLLSGQDLPIKTQDQIHTFFECHSGEEFISFGSEEWIDSVRFRCSYYWLLQEFIGKKGHGILHRLDKISTSVQKCMGINRLRKRKFKAGANWFSITDNFAQYIYSKIDEIRKLYKFTVCADECFLQCVAVESGYEKTAFIPGIDDKCSPILRSIDWERGGPYVYRQSDFDELIHSGNMFARKFDCTVDNEIISMIAEFVSGNS